jgi:hypothetical protein
VFEFTGSAGERVAILLAPAIGETSYGRANLVLTDTMGNTVDLVSSDRTEIPNRITETLPADGSYRIGVSEPPGVAFLPGPFFEGAYCLTLDGDSGAAPTLLPTASVEGLESEASTPAEPGSIRPRGGRTQKRNPLTRTVRRR